MRLFVSFFLIALISSSVAAQEDKNVLENRKIVGEPVVLKSSQKVYDPRKASRRSAILPGWGQIYNDSWWKVPILYTGLGVAIHFIGVNEGLRNDNLDRVNEELAKPNPDQNAIRVFRRRADTWRKNRDLVFLTIAGIYALQIIDAAVDAHLKGFNVDENLALNVKPKLGVISNGAPYLGFRITLPIGK